ncbi:MAG: TonB family protein [Planctomycetota bacterium]
MRIFRAILLAVALAMLPSVLPACSTTRDAQRPGLPSETAPQDAGRASPSAAGLYSEADLDQRPRVAYQPAPPLNQATRAKAPGWVLVIFIVDEHGKVENPKVQSSSDPVFEGPALTAVKDWVFEPGKRNGRPVRVRMRVPVTFSAASHGPEPASPALAAEEELPAPGSSPRFHLTGAELAIWNNPDFKRRFTESYIAETEVEPAVTVLEREQMNEVLELMASDRADKAVGLLEKHRGEAASAVFDFTLANIYFQKEQLEPALEAYQAALAKFPRFRRAWRNLGLIRVRQSDFTNAVPALTRVLELGGNDAITYGLLGYSCSNVEDYVAAESAFRMATLLDPGTMDWRMGLARSLFKQERFADAVALCDPLIAGQPERADLWLLQANAYVGLNQPLKAAENLELVDRLGRAGGDSLNMLGDIYVNEELFDLAVESYTSALERDPASGPDRALRAVKVLAARGAYQESRQLLESIEALRGDRLAPAERKELLKLRARVAVAEGAGDEEVRVLEEIVELDPLDGEALILLGQHCSRVGALEKAVFYFERAASMEAYEADAKVRHAQLLVGQGRYAEALPLLRSAQALKPRENTQEYLEQVERAAQGR